MPRTRIFLDKFSPEGEFVVLRSTIKCFGEVLKRGDQVPKDWFTTRRLRQMYDARMIGRSADYVYVRPVRRKKDYDAVLAHAFERAAEREAGLAMMRAESLHAQSDAVDLTPARKEQEPQEPVVEFAATAEEVIEVPLLRKQVDEPNPQYDLADMGIEAPSAPSKQVKKKR